MNKEKAIKQLDQLVEKLKKIKPGEYQHDIDGYEAIGITEKDGNLLCKMCAAIDLVSDNPMHDLEIIENMLAEGIHPRVILILLTTKIAGKRPANMVVVEVPE